MLRSSLVVSGLTIGGLCLYKLIANSSKRPVIANSSKQPVIANSSKQQEYIPVDVNKTYYKVLKKNLLHHEHLYQLGLNEDKLKFNPTGECDSGGLYFCDLDDVARWIDLYIENEYVAEVKLLEDSLVVKQQEKYKTNKFVLQNLVLIGDFLETHNLEKKAVLHNGYSIKYVKNQTPELCLIALKLDPGIIIYIKKFNLEIYDAT